MKGLTHIAVLVALCIWHDCRADSKVQQGVYNYKSSVTIHNEASDDSIGRWTLSGTLTSQQLGKKLVLQLNDIKTSIYNGPKENPKNVVEKSIPENMTALQEPFVLNVTSSTDINIAVLPDEPMWVINMKRAIASIFVTQFTDDTVTERSVYGDCEVAYKFGTESSDTNIYFTKIINHKKCTNDYYVRWGNVAWASVNSDFNPLQLSTLRNYKADSKTKVLKNIESYSNITYRTMPSVRTGHHIQQIQLFKLVKTNEAPALDVSKNTFETNLHYEGAEKIEEPASIQELTHAYENILKEFATVPLENANSRSNQTIDQMYNFLYNMNQSTFDLLSRDILLKPDSGFRELILSLIPYAGNDRSINFVKDIVESDSINQFVIIKLLATYPTYIQYENDELITSLQYLLNLKRSKHMKIAGILSFSRLVGKAVDNQTRSNYIDMYYKRFKAHEEHEDRMTYLLGLINMKAEIVNTIIYDTQESSHIRALAIYGFRKQLASNSEQTFTNFWPMVKNASESFEVRIAALDVCFSLELTPEQFYEIVDYYGHQDLEDVHDQHLSNYVYTTLHSLTNTTKYYNYFDNLATTRLAEGNVPHYQSAWPTGNYRVAYTDAAANYGASLQTRLVANPVSNAIEVVQITYDNFELSLDMGVYTAYIKLHGILDYEFIGKFLRNRPNDETPVQALVDLIAKYKYKLKDVDDLHIEVVLFCDGVAVHGFHINDHNIGEYNKKERYRDLIQLIPSYRTVSKPVSNFVEIISDLGTSVIVSNSVQSFTTTAIENLQYLTQDSEVKLKYRSAWSQTISLITHNPLLATEITSYQYYSDEKYLHIPVTLNTSSLIVSWKNRNDSFNWVYDRIIGININDAEALHSHCAECDDYNELPIGHKEETIYKMEKIGMKFIVNNANCTDNEIDQLRLQESTEQRFENFLNSHRSNTYLVPLAAPILYIWHYMAYSNYMINQLDSVSVRSAVVYDEPYKTELEFNIDGEKITAENDPIDGNKMVGSVSLASKTIKDDNLLNYLNAALILSMTPKATGDDVPSQVEIKQALLLDSIIQNGNRSKICVNREVWYPIKRSDKLSLKPVDPAVGRIVIAWGSVASDDDTNCPSTNIKLTEMFSATEEQNSRAKGSEDYKKCIEDSQSMKYVPPTDACRAAHHDISRYTTYSLYADFKQAGDLAKLHGLLPTEELRIKVLECNDIGESRINTTISHDLTSVFFVHEINKELLTFETTFDFVSISADPTSLAYHDEDVIFGVYRKCDITPYDIRTFTGRNFSLFEKEPDKEIVAFVECLNETRSGVTVQRINDKKVGFKFWSGDNLVVATVVGDKMKVTVNGEERVKTDAPKNDDKLTVFFLEDDVIYVFTEITEIYYNTEYVSLKTWSIFDNYICGECGYYSDPVVHP